MTKKRSHKKINYIFLIAGILTILVFMISFYFSWKDWNIRINGEMRSEKIVDISGRISRPQGSAWVIIDGVKLNAGSIAQNNSIGDLILVRYIPGEYCVIQERVNPNRYYLYFFLEFLLLIMGIAIFVESLKGKDIWSYIK